MDLLVVAITLQHISEYANNVHPSDKENDPVARANILNLNLLISNKLRGPVQPILGFGFERLKPMPRSIGIPVERMVTRIQRQALIGDLLQNVA
jgi:hypothetical protein